MPLLAEGLADRGDRAVGRFAGGAETGEQRSADRFRMKLLPALDMEGDVVDRRRAPVGRLSKGFGKALLGEACLPPKSGVLTNNFAPHKKYTPNSYGEANKFFAMQHCG